MSRRGAVIFLLLQLFFIALGFSLFFGLKTLKETQRAARAQHAQTQADSPAQRTD